MDAPAARTGTGKARAVMFQGTGSDVGKSLLTAGLARVLTNRGYKVLPFKPQNMSNNAAVTSDGGEIGRAQALQALAARADPVTDMNPVLLKPQGASGAQIIVQGKVHANAGAAAYQTIKRQLLPAVMESFERLRLQADFVLVEGAGSAAETNLRTNDIANMGFARTANVPVILIGDIDRGGVIAALAGTKLVIDPKDAALICGFIVNRFRGDPALFADGMTRIARLTGWRALGLVPHFPDAATLPAEDALALASPDNPEPDNPATGPHRNKPVRIVIPLLPHIANFDDFDPLRAEPQVELNMIRPGHALPGDGDLIILPGSKSTIADLAALRDAGFDIDIAAHLRRGGLVLGICGGFQMLGKTVHDPDGIEGTAQNFDALGLLDMATTLSPAKRLGSVSGQSFDGAPLDGYLMHMGRSEGAARARPFARLDNGTEDGAIDPTGRIFGTYVHGLFANDAQRSAWLKRLGGRDTEITHGALVDQTLNALAAHLEQHLDIDTLIEMSR